MEKFQIMGKKLEHHGHILDFYTYELKVPNGNTAYWDVLEHKGASAIIPVDEDGKIILVRQYRGAIDDLLLEIPNHMDDKDLSFLEDLLPWSEKLPDHCRKPKPASKR